jgi:hypothetical protein
MGQVFSALDQQRSPVQIASEASICLERICQHIADDRQRDGMLWCHLRCHNDAAVIVVVRHDNVSAFTGAASPSGR